MRTLIVSLTAASLVAMCAVAQQATPVVPAQTQQPASPAVETANPVTAPAQADVAPTKANAPKEERTRVDFVLNVLPASLFVNMDSSDFRIDRADGTEGELSDVFLMPNLAAGVGVELGDFYIDLTGGAGILVNDSLQSFLLQAILTASYEATQSFKIGPHGGLIYFTDPNWQDDDDLDLDADWGYMIGLQMAMGDRILYLVSVDFIDVSFDASLGDADLDSIDLSGLAVQFGVRGEF